MERRVLGLIKDGDHDDDRLVMADSAKSSRALSSRRYQPWRSTSYLTFAGANFFFFVSQANHFATSHAIEIQYCIALCHSKYIELNVYVFCWCSWQWASDHDLDIMPYFTAPGWFWLAEAVDTPGNSLPSRAFDGTKLLAQFITTLCRNAFVLIKWTIIMPIMLHQTWAPIFLNMCCFDRCWLRNVGRHRAYQPMCLPRNGLLQ